ncbi:unnamed protein product [Cuscuta campestris]|uniref:Uncharacterized protein n=1 Tax=Cuscuta campestris TaxID=132261 RepID=A0A484K269_9ASTE|nr:unnamed protein product [Cuscuta campestris]
MGSCASLHKDQETLMNRRLVNPSPVKLQSAAVDRSKFSDTLPSPTPLPASADFGSKDETFFDSQLYFESDCDDDFHSVKGDFTPSRGNTPVHHRFPAGGTTVLMSDRIPICTPSITSPTDQIQKKSLADFFRESSCGGAEEEDEEVGRALDSSMNAATNMSTPGSSAFCSSACSSSRTTATTTTAASHSQELKLSVSSESRKQGQCCLPVPRLLSRRSFGAEKKNTPRHETQ